MSAYDEFIRTPLDDLTAVIAGQVSTLGVTNVHDGGRPSEFAIIGSDGEYFLAQQSPVSEPILVHKTRIWTIYCEDSLPVIANMLCNTIARLKGIPPDHPMLLARIKNEIPQFVLDAAEKHDMYAKRARELLAAGAN